MKIINLIEELVLEASKKDILINKLGFSSDNAEVLSSIAGPFSVWLANKMIDEWVSSFDNKIPNRMEAVNGINRRGAVRGNWSSLVSIMDWIRIGLNGNVEQYKNLSFLDLYQESLKWHKLLGTSDGDINYIENNQIIRDYRKDGIGFYWVDLQTNNAEEECRRMGHCGRTSSLNTIYSLRENRRINDKFTINKSHITAAIGKNNGIIYQMKGTKNSKPLEKYYPYILDFLMNEKNITGFGSEYNSGDDFKITDLSKEEILKLYEVRPDLFNTYSLKKMLNKLGIGEAPKMIFELNIPPENIEDYVDGNWVVRTGKNSDGSKTEYKFFTILLDGDIYEMSGNYYEDWEGALEYETNEENTKKIREILQHLVGEDYDPEDNMESLIKQYDDDDEIKRALGDAYQVAADDSYYVHSIKLLTRALSEYGTVLELNYEGAKLQVHLDKYINENDWIDDDYIQGKMEDCNEDLKCVFKEFISEGDKPKFSIDDRWTPDIDEKNFNEILKNGLDEIDIPTK